MRAKLATLFTGFIELQAAQPSTEKSSSTTLLSKIHHKVPRTNVALAVIVTFVLRMMHTKMQVPKTH